MSVLLSACRIRNKNAPKSAKSKRKKRNAHVRRVEVPESTPGLKVWRFEIQDTIVQVTFRKDTMEVWCNDVKVDTADNFSDLGGTHDFNIFDQEASIQRKVIDGRLDHVLMVDGYMLEEYKEAHTSNGHAHGAYANENDEYNMAMANGLHDVTLEEKKNA